MKYLLSLLTCLLLSIGSYGQTKTEHYFGFNLMPSANGDLVTFAIVHVEDGKVVRSSTLHRDKWMRLVAGEQKSEANDSLKNLFIEFEVDSCWVHYDAEYFKYGKKVYVGYDCNAVANLWMLRYKTHPTKYGVEGLSKGFYTPTGDQWAFLEHFYGLGSQAEYCYGPQMFKLLKDMADPEWADFYKAADLTWGTDQSDIDPEPNDSIDEQEDQEDDE